MNTLFTIDLSDYDPAWPHFCRPSARALIERDGLYAMVYSAKYDYYKTPGGGIEKDETPEQALMREVREETGLQLAADSICPFGKVSRLQADSFGEPLIFEQQNLYYFAKASDSAAAQMLDDYEAAEGFCLRYVSLNEVIKVNRTHPHGDADAVMIDREARLVELLRASQK